MPGVAMAAMFLGDLTVGASSAARSLGIPSQLGAVVQGVLLLTTVALLALRRQSRSGRLGCVGRRDRPTGRRGGGGAAGMTFLVDLLAATLRNATPLVYGTVGETYAERSGVLNLGIEGTMYAGAFAGFATAFATGSPAPGAGWRRSSSASVQAPSWR